MGFFRDIAKGAIKIITPGFDDRMAETVVDKTSLGKHLDKAEEITIEVVQKGPMVVAAEKTTEVLESAINATTDFAFEKTLEVIRKAAYLKGKNTKPTPEDMKKFFELSKLVDEIIKTKDISKLNFLWKMFEKKNASEIFLLCLVLEEKRGQLSREDVQHYFEVQKAYDKGIRVGELIAAKKFATLLEQSDNMRIGAFALGCHVARLGGNSEEKLGVIVDALGEPDSFALSKYVRSENSKIIRDEPTFGEICNRYLDSLDSEQLKAVDGFVMEIINVGGTSPSEKSFYQNEWLPYLNRRIK